LATDKELSDFLKSVEKRAFKRAVYAVRNDDAALEDRKSTRLNSSH
jgi:RNA polymerase sigma-70 factor (ECF subfamily)